MTYPEDAYRRIEPGFAIGGALKRDRAWLFAAYQPALIHTERTVTFTFDKSTATKASDQTAHSFNINQTMQVHDNLRTRATLDWSPSRQDGILPALDGATYPGGNFDSVDRTQNYACGGGSAACISIYTMKADGSNVMKLTEDSRMIYETIGKLAGINVLFDPDYTSRRIKVDLNSVSLEEALQIVQNYQNLSQ